MKQQTLLFIVFFFCSVLIGCKPRQSNNEKMETPKDLNKGYKFDSVAYSAKSQNEFGVWDSIRDLQMSGGPIGHPYGYTYGIRVFPKSKDSATISKIIEDNDIFFCLIPKKRNNIDWKYPEEIYAFANLDINDFSLGGPYSNLSDSMIASKFNNSIEETRLEPDSVSECEDGDCDCPPYLYSVYTKNDTISYSRANHFGQYDFCDATITGPKYHFGEYRVGKDIRLCRVGKAIPSSLFDRYQVVRLVNHKNYLIFGIEQPPKYQIEVVLFLDGYIIRKIYVSYED